MSRRQWEIKSETYPKLLEDGGIVLNHGQPEGSVLWNIAILSAGLDALEDRDVKHDPVDGFGTHDESCLALRLGLSFLRIGSVILVVVLPRALLVFLLIRVSDLFVGQFRDIEFEQASTALLPSFGSLVEMVELGACREPGLLALFASFHWSRSMLVMYLY